MPDTTGHQQQSCVHVQMLVIAAQEGPVQIRWSF